MGRSLIFWFLQERQAEMRQASLGLVGLNNFNRCWVCRGRLWLSGVWPWSDQGRGKLALEGDCPTEELVGWVGSGSVSLLVKDMFLSGQFVYHLWELASSGKCSLPGVSKASRYQSIRTMENKKSWLIGPFRLYFV